MDHVTLREPLRETAAAWHDRLHRDKVPDETRAAFALWLAESPEHRAAYEEIDRTWSELKSAAHNSHILALRHETALRLTRRTSKSIRPLTWAAAALILVVLGTTLAALSTRSTSDRSPIAFLLDAFRSQGDGRYATATGERLTVTLKDGSQLTLNTQTELKVAFTQAERTVHLTRGQAVFEVAKDPTRPFVVEAYNRRFIAVGTAFDVRLDGAQIKVTMIEGTVRVERTTNLNATANPTPIAMRSTTASAKSGTARTELDTPASPPPVVTTLTAGEQLTVDNQSQDHVRSADPERVTSWRRGQVIFESTRLADAIAELNRYSATQIELADPALADLRLSGAFATGRPTVFVEAITAYFPIQIERADDRAVILSARK
jgi:transmembrane sensor